jgi:hypothetical protein
MLKAKSLEYKGGRKMVSASAQWEIYLGFLGRDLDADDVGTNLESLQEHILENSTFRLVY